MAVSRHPDEMITAPHTRVTPRLDPQRRMVPPDRIRGCDIDVVAIDSERSQSVRKIRLGVNGRQSLGMNDPAIRLIFTTDSCAGVLLGNALVLLRKDENVQYTGKYRRGSVTLRSVSASEPVALGEDTANEILLLQETGGNGRWAVEIPAGRIVETRDALALGRYEICNEGEQIRLRPRFIGSEQ